MAERANASDAPASQAGGNFPGAFFGRGEADGRDFAADAFGAPKKIVEIGDGFDVDETVEGGELKAGVGLVKDSPSSRVVAAPEARIGRVGSADFVEGAFRGDGGGIGWRKGTARLSEFARGELGGELLGELFGG